MFARDDLLKVAESMDPLPVSSTRLTQILSKEDWTLSDVAKAVTLDPALTGRVLRYANSAVSGSQQAVKEAGVAVMRMGSKLVLSIALGDGLNSQIDPAVPAETELWKHSVGAALAIAVLNKSGVKSPDGAFTAAIVHDVGKLVIGRKLRSMGIVLTSNNPAQPWVDESEQLGIDHAELGESIVRTWAMPTEIAAAVRHHHTPQQLEPGPAQDIARFVCAADLIAHRVGDEEPFYHPLVESHLRLGQEDQEKVRNATRTLLDGVMDLYS